MFYDMSERSVEVERVSSPASGPVEVRDGFHYTWRRMNCIVFGS